MRIYESEHNNKKVFLSINNKGDRYFTTEIGRWVSDDRNLDDADFDWTLIYESKPEPEVGMLLENPKDARELSHTHKWLGYGSYGFCFCESDFDLSNTKDYPITVKWLEKKND